MCVFSCSVMFDSLSAYRLWPTSLLCPWNFPGRNIRVGCHFLLQGIFLTQALNRRLLSLLHWQEDFLPLKKCKLSYNYKVKGSRTDTPKWVPLACGLFWAEGNQDPADSGETFLSLYCLKEFRSQAWPRMKAITRDSFTSAMADIWLPKPALLTFLWRALHLSEASDSIWILSSGWQRSLNCLTAFESFVCVCSHMNKIECVFPLLIHLISI